MLHSLLRREGYLINHKPSTVKRVSLSAGRDAKRAVATSGWSWTNRNGSLPGKRVARVLDRIALSRDLPEVITVDNGPEFISKALDLRVFEAASS